MGAFIVIIILLSFRCKSDSRRQLVIGLIKFDDISQMSLCEVEACF